LHWITNSFFAKHILFEDEWPFSVTLTYDMDIHNEFTQWALAWGVKLNGMATHRLPGKGFGIIAEKNLKVYATHLHTAFIHVVIGVT
jgi:hypothetical protein